MLRSASQTGCDILSYKWKKCKVGKKRDSHRLSFSHSFSRSHRDFFPPWMLGSADNSSRRRCISIVGIFSCDAQHLSEQKTVKFVADWIVIYLIERQHSSDVSRSWKMHSAFANASSDRQRTSNVGIWSKAVLEHSCLSPVVVCCYVPSEGEALMLNCPKASRHNRKLLVSIL